MRIVLKNRVKLTCYAGSASKASISLQPIGGESIDRLLRFDCEAQA